MTIELHAMDLAMNALAVLGPASMTASLALLFVLRLLSKRILKQHERADTCNLWEIFVTENGYETIPSKSKGGDIE